MKIEVKTCEGTKVDVTNVKSLYHIVPLKEILGFSFDKYTNKYIPVYNREKFESFYDNYKYENGTVKTLIRWESCGTMEEEIDYELSIDDYYDKMCPIRR